MTLNIQVAEVFRPLLAHSRYKGAHGGRGSGKCLAIGTEVLMYDGALKKVEEVLVGDLLMGPDSAPRVVIGTNRGYGRLFRIYQRGGAEPYVVNEHHILSLKRCSSNRHRKYGDELDIPLKEYKEKSRKFKSSFKGYKSGQLTFSKKRLPIPPYILGLWLGDGDKSRVTITSMDKEIISEFSSWGKSIGCRIVKTKGRGKAKKVHIRRVNGQDQQGPARKLFLKLSLFYNKHIPLIYQTSSMEDRLELLAGLVDTDGHSGNGCCTISQKKYELARSIKFVADTCGFKTSIRRIRKRAQTGFKRRYYVVCISGNVQRLPLRLKRKSFVASPNKDFLLNEINPRFIGYGEYAGFELSGDGRFLLRDCTVTHNSHFYAGLATAACLQSPGARIACLREVQRSLRDSVKLLISDKIKEYGVEDSFKIMYDHIRTPGGGLIIFQGLQDHTAESIKSLEGFDVAYLEEAHTITKRSLELLRPTIRKPGSQIWASWNPRLATDPIDELLRGEHKPPNATVVQANWRDNPWFPEALEEERQFDEVYNPVRYAHIWDGEYEPQVIGALWDRATINAGRVIAPPALKRVVIGVDPPKSSEDGANECGIVAAGLGEDDHGYVLADESAVASPEAWARRVVALHDILEADAVVAETNQGGEMVRSTIQTVRPGIRVIMVHAKHGKITRAEPISALYTLGRVHHVGTHAKLEGQLCLATSDGWKGVGSPDRMDAAVYSLTNLFGPMTRRQGPGDRPRPNRTNQRP